MTANVSDAKESETRFAARFDKTGRGRGLRITGTSTTYQYQHWRNTYNGTDLDIDSIAYGSGCYQRICTLTAPLTNVYSMGGGLYKPDTNMTRAQFVTILWRYAGSPEPTAAASFTDLDKTQTWYMKAVAWAYEKGIVNGIGAGRFGPNGLVTREQMMTILFRYSGQTPGIEQGLYAGAFRDGDQISPWAKTALYWAVYNNVYCGVSAVSAGDTLAPGGKATRAQIAVVMVKYSEAFSK